MLSEIERIFPNNCNNMQIDIDAIVSVRKKRSELFNEQYFTNKFWDIILLLYSHEINDLPIDSSAIEEDCFDLARDNLSLTRRGFENAGTIVQQTRKIFSSIGAI